MQLRLIRRSLSARLRHALRASGRSPEPGRMSHRMH